MTDKTVTVKTSRGPVLVTPRVAREVAITRARGQRRLPKSWHEPGLRERMSDWLKLFGPEGKFRR